MVPLGLILKFPQQLFHSRGHLGPEVRDHRICPDHVFKWFYGNVEGLHGQSGDLVTAVLGEQDLLGGEIEVFVRDDLVPALFCVEGDAVCGDAFVVCWVEDVVWIFFRYKPEA